MKQAVQPKHIVAAVLLVLVVIGGLWLANRGDGHEGGLSKEERAEMQAEADALVPPPDQTTDTRGDLRQ